MLKLEGRIGGPWVDELRQTWSTAVERGGAEALKLDMRGVSYVDRRGAELLLQMEDEGASLAHCSDFIRQQLSASRGNETGRKISKQAKKES